MTERELDLAIIDSELSWYTYHDNSYVAVYIAGVSEGDVVSDSIYTIGDTVLPQNLVNNKQFFKVIRGKDKQHPTDRVALVTDAGLVKKILEDDFYDLQKDGSVMDEIEAMADEEDDDGNATQ